MLRLINIVKETGITLVIFVLKNMPIINCYVARWQFNRGELLQWISYLGNSNSDHIHLIEVTVQLFYGQIYSKYEKQTFENW